MNFKRRLLNLENRPFKRPIQKPRFSEMDESIRRKLCLPLPQESTPEEFAHALAMMQAAQKTPVDDQSGWQAVRSFALSLHRKYDGKYANEPDEMSALS